MNNPANLSSDFLHSIAALRDLSTEAVEELTTFTSPIMLHTGETLFTTGEPFKDELYILGAGKIELQRPGQPSAIVEPGYILGIANYVDSTPYLSTAIASSEVTLHTLPAEKLRQAEHKYPEIVDAFNRLFTERIRSQASAPIKGVWALPARAIMQAPLATCSPTTTIQDAFAIMNQRRIGSLGVIDDTGQLAGLITFVTLAHGLITKSARPIDNVVDAASAAPYCVSADVPLWEVQRKQTRLGAKYLVVIEEEKAIGIISQTDVLYTLVSYQRSLIAQVNNAKNFAELKTLSKRLGPIARELRQNNRSAGMAVRALSEIHLAVQRRCIELVLKEIYSADMSEPPVPFAFIIMGSGGRKEMMIKTDQDNGIILADRPNTTAPQTQRWFMSFCDQVNHRLDEIGYDWCTGGIMARNADFHKSFFEWQQQLSQIAEMPTEKTARWSTIFFDFETLYGDDRLTIALRNHLFSELKQKPRLLKLMVEDDATGGPALGLFNRLITASDKTRRGKIDLKRNGTRIVADVARIYALSEGIAATNTGDRLSALVRQGRLDSDFAESALAAYDELLDITLGHQLRQLENGEPLDKLLKPNELTPIEEESLRMAMRIVKHLQGRMQGEFGTVML